MTTLSVCDAQVNLAEADVIRGLQIFARGEDVKHDNGDFTVDDQFVTELLESYRKITAAGFRVPILVEHQSNGKIYGQVIKLYADDTGVYIDAEFAQGIKDEWERGERGNLSPSVWKERPHPHTGEMLPNLLREVSMVSVPHLKNLKQPQFHYSLSESGFLTAEPAKEPTMANETTPAEPAEEPTENMDGEEYDMADVMKRIEAMEKNVTALMEHVMPKDDEPDESGESKDMAEVKREVAKLKRENAKLRVANELGLEGQDLLDMAETLVTSPKAYNLAAKQIRKNSDKEIGRVGSAARTGNSGPSNFSEAKALAREAGAKPGKPTMLWIKKNHPKHLPENLNI